MIQQVAVAHQVHTAVSKQAAHVLLQLLAVHKRGMNLVHQFPFLIGQAIRVSRVDSREVGVAQFVFLTLVDKYAPF